MLRLLNRTDHKSLYILRGDNKNLSKTFYSMSHNKFGPADQWGRVDIESLGKESFQKIVKANGKIRDDVRKRERKKKSSRNRFETT
tara:strand:+ start:988 stop:1245 length:258 start_codon:yes stop_codon:yes gene_type:complete